MQIMVKQIIGGMMMMVLCAITTSFSLIPAVSASNQATDSIPSYLRGNFEDDYGIKYSINDSLWIQHPSTKYHIIACDTTEKYLLVKNDMENKTDGGLFTRIDYMQFTNMQPFGWGFCLTIYNATTVEKAKAMKEADRNNPKTGCGGYPFSRMKRLN